PQDRSSYLDHLCDYLQHDPDSPRTPQQQKRARQLLDITIEHVKVADNRMFFDMSKDQYRQTGIPMEYYRLFKKDMKINNQYNKKHNINDVDEMLHRFRRDARK